MTKKNSSFIRTVAVLFAFASLTSQAETLLWYRFNGEGANVPNVAATADGLPDGTVRATDGTIKSITTYGSNPVYGNDAAEMPVVTNLFQQVAPRIIDQKTGAVYAGGKTLHFGEDGLTGGVIVPYNEAFNLTEFTVEVMVRFPEEAAARTSTDGKMFPLVQFGRDNYEGWFFAVYDGFPFVRVNYVGTNGKEYKTQGSTTSKMGSYMKYMPTLFDGQWHHLGLRFHVLTSANQLYAYFYVDGKMCGGKSFNYFSSWILNGNCPLAIGCQPYYNNANRTFWGDIAEVRISDEKLEENNLLVPLMNGPADDDTALLLTFDSAAKGIGCTNQYVVPCIQDTTAASPSTNHIWFGGNWNILNAAYNSPYIPRWYPFADKGNTDHLLVGLRPTLSTNDTWGMTYGADAMLGTNAGSVNFPTCQPDGQAAPGTDVINVPYPACALSSGDFTIECVLKSEAADTTEADTFINCPFLKWCVFQGKPLARGYRTSYGNAIGDISPGTAVMNDHDWHHVAVVYKSGVLSQYVDYQRCSTTRTNTLHVGTNDGSDDGRFFIGAQKRAFGKGSSTSDAQAFKGKIDAVRITRRALTTGEFLSTRSTAPLMTMTFDDAEHPYAPGQTGAIAPDEGVAGSFTGGVVPEIVNSRDGWYVLDGSNGVDKVECGKAVQFAGSTLYWKNAMLLERKSLTVEFFARFTSFAKAASLLRCVKTDAVNGTIVWVFWKTNGGDLQFSSFPVKSDGTIDSQQNKTIKTGFLPDGETDTAWHHWALTVDSTDGQHIYAKVYKDYEQFGDTATINGTLDVPPKSGNHVGLSIGANGKIYGMFDQIRVSAGILPVDKFMRYAPKKGLVIIVQ